ncbi:superinfection immunity protein [Candidatus Nomurabacteria bacterium]|nr:superinfection immunity protein [Candidatus Nomurabacteria bacterium]
MVYAILIFALYFLPSINAYWKKKRNKSAVLTLNFFLGWTVIGWIVALIWSSTNDAPATVVIEKNTPVKSTSNELVELHALKEKGVITHEEFEAGKKKILG